jgi:hypothetical protein
VLEAALVALLWSLELGVVEVLGVEVDGDVDCCCCWVCVAFGSWELLGVPEDGDWSCAKAILAANRNVADVNKAAFFIVSSKIDPARWASVYSLWVPPPASGNWGRT